MNAGQQSRLSTLMNGNIAGFLTEAEREELRTLVGKAEKFTLEKARLLVQSISSETWILSPFALEATVDFGERTMKSNLSPHHPKVIQAVNEKIRQMTPERSPGVSQMSHA